jgi:hypothetical protein
MKKFEIKSVFEQIATQVFTMKDATQAKAFIIDFVTSKGIKDADKQNIINIVNECRNIARIQAYICNSLLKYEGMSVNLK